MKVLVTTIVCVATIKATEHRELRGGNSLCPQPGNRVRKAWEMMSTQEQDTYKNALDAAMTSGMYNEFIQVHMVKTAEMVAHDTCAFALWHRRYVLAMENMLRDISDADGGKPYACVTIPYWNTMYEFQRQADGECGNMEECSPIILALGGRPESVERRTFNGQSVSNQCYAGPPFTNYCDDNQQCGCMLRNDMKTKAVPTGSSYVSLFRMIVASKDYNSFTAQLQSGVHNEIHAAIGGFMSTFASPSDPLFFSWHSTVDMLMFIWHNCHLATPITANTAEYAFDQDQKCRRTKRAKDGLDPISQESQIYMTVDGQDVRSHPKIGVYFRDVGSQYKNFADTRLLGDFRYGYLVPDGFYRMLTDKSQCPSAGLINWPKPTTPDDTTGSKDGELSYWEWYAQQQARLMIKFKNNTDEVNKHLEYLECLGFDEKIGVQTFDDEFIKDFLDGKDVEPRCKKIVDDIKNGTTIVDESEKDKWGGRVRVTKDRHIGGDVISSASILEASFFFGFIIQLIL